MTATTVARKTQARLSAFDMFWTLVSGATDMFHGGMGEVYNGLVYPAGTNGAGAVAVGRISANDGISELDAGEYVRVDSGIFRWANSAGADAIAVAEIGDKCYVVDDATVALTNGAGARIVAGEIVDVDDNGVWVLQGFGVRTEGSPIHTASLAFGFADLTESDGSQQLDFAAALPLLAVVIGYGLAVTAIFDNAGDTATTTCDLGHSGGDEYLDAASLNAVAAAVATPQGTGVGAMVGAVTPSVVVDSDVNVVDHTKGAAVAYVLYTLARG